MNNFDRPMTKRNAIALAKRSAKRNPGKSFVVYFDHRDDKGKEYYDIYTYETYMSECCSIRAESVILIVTWHNDIKRFCYD